MWHPARWVSLMPQGLGHRKPHHYLEMARVAWRNRDELPFAWRILNDGVCDGCALGTSGMSDWTIPGVHLCLVRLELMRLNTAPALDPGRVRDVAPLARLSSTELRALGRLPEPMRRRRGDPGFHVISWNEALDLVADRLRRQDPQRVAIYLTSRGITNEVYYAAQKAARFLGSNHVDNSARLCHAASTAAMKTTLGHGASSCSYTDWLGADLIVFFGSNTPNNQPVTTKYLCAAKAAGAQVAVVNTYREPGLDRYWVPSVVESSLFGTRLADHWFDVDTGGDLAFLTGVFRALIEAQARGGQGAAAWAAGASPLDEGFIRHATTGFEDARRAALAADWAELASTSGSSEARMRAFADLLRERPNAIFVWSMGLTQHTHGVETVKALINVALARGLFGRTNCGVMPIRGHSGVQGGAEVGCVPGIDPAVRARWSTLWGFPVPDHRGLTAAEMVEASAAGRIDVFWNVGGNFLETLPGRARSHRALALPRLRIHQDVVLSSSMLVEPAEDVLLLPATTRYESVGGGTETSTERRIIFSPEIPGRRIGSARPEWWVFGEVAARARPEDGAKIRFEDAAAIRAEIAQAIPLYRGIESLTRKGDQVQWGGRILYPDLRFDTPDRKARFSVVEPAPRARAVDTLYVSTRRGRQFNSMVHAQTDPLTGAARDEILMSRQDAVARGLSSGASVRLVSPFGELRGRVKLGPMRPGNIEVHWPEGMPLLSPEAIDPVSLEPDYNTTVAVERV